MPQGTIKKLVSDRGFGFISGADQGDVFFHLSKLDGVSFEELQIGQAVEYEVDDDEGRGRGPRASSVRPAPA